MELAILVLRLLTISQVLFLCLYMLTQQRHKNGLLIGVICFCFAAYLYMPFIEQYNETTTILSVLHFSMVCAATSIPALLWLLAFRFFSDAKSTPLLFWIIWLGYLSLALINWQQTPTTNGLQMFFLQLLPQFVKLGFVLHVIYLALEGRANDLINQRLNTRIPIALGTGSLSAVVILVELSTNGSVSLEIELFGSIVMLIGIFATNLYLFSLRSDFSLSDPQKILVPSATPSAHRDTENTAKEVDRIQQSMKTHRFYAKHGATIGDLADSLAIPPYRLRVLINQTLGFRNFNQYLNQFRIQEASQRLLTEPGLPIISIALDTGFKSLSSFNKAFKATHGITPTEFRANKA